MKIGLYFITDGRIDLLKQTLQSFHEKVKFDFAIKYIFNDCLDAEFKKEVNMLCVKYNMMALHHEVKKGFSGVYNTAWQVMIQYGCDYYMGIEDDFEFNEDINLYELLTILQYNRNLVQVSLKRQSWSESEKLAGGIIEQSPNDYEDKSFAGIKWCEQRKYYTTNPNITPRHIVEMGWPLDKNSEGVLSCELFKNPNNKAAIYGHKFDAPKINHLGLNRVGINY